MPFPKIPSHPNFYTLQQEILKFREENNIFEKSINQRSSDDSFRFYDGPPFKNGLPHYGHALQSTIKDIIPRFWSMKGKRVERKRGWDCHGIYIEQKVQKKLGLESNKDIEAYGIDKFMKACVDFTNEANEEWDRFIPNLGRRVDFKNAYETSSPKYMESVRWVFKNLWDKGLIYKGKRVSMYSTKLNTAISSFEVQADNSYAEVPDPAITVKFPVTGYKNNPKYEIYKNTIEHTHDGFGKAAFGVIKNSEGCVLCIYGQKMGNRSLPGGKIDIGETAEEAVLREVEEEIGVKCKIIQKIGSVKFLHGKVCANREYFELEIIEGIPKAMEVDTTNIGYIEIFKSDRNSLGFGYKVNNLILEEEEDIIKEERLQAYINSRAVNNNISESKNISFLARTTTPRTIPANLALVVSPNISYIQIFDIEKQEYFVLAENLVSKFYKDSSAYIIIYKCKGVELEGISYRPPYDYYSSVGTYSDMSDNKNNFQVYLADYVTDTDGTGIVHTAPEFGEDDFKTGLKYGLTQTEALDEAGKYTAEVSDYTGIYYRDANDVIMNNLKERGLLFKKESITHTVAICPRTQVPLIFKTQDSWFINIQSVKEKLIEKCKEINRIPDHIRLGRFLKNIESAPDRCISRTRYRATPMPVWTDEQGNFKVIGSLEELFKLDQSGSKIMKKYTFIRHGESIKNIEKRRDSKGLGLLTENGVKQGKKIADKLHFSPNVTIVISPLKRAFQTIESYLEKHFSTKINDIRLQYDEIRSRYEILHDSGEIFHFVKDVNKAVFKLADNVYVDFRICETLRPQHQGKIISHLYNELEQRNDDDSNGESNMALYDRVSESINFRSQKSSDLIFISHGDPVLMMKKHISGKSYNEELSRYPKRASITNFYRDTINNKEFDLHRPYIDNVRGYLKPEEFDNFKGADPTGLQDHSNSLIRATRVSEVLDPWLDSGSMPYAQDHYPFENEQHFKDGFPADFIGEGLGQIRAWFYVMHVLSVTLFDTIAYKNAICTGTVLGNDGRKMSKIFGNYPDVKPTIEAYGADSIRMFYANSPLLNGGDQSFTEESLREIIKKVHLPLWNSFSFFVTYANIDGFSPTKFSINDLIDTNFENDLDAWIVGKTAQLLNEVDVQIQSYNIQKATTPIYEFLDDLTNRYIRRSRRRFWKGEMDIEKLQGYETLFVVLLELCKVLAPFMPFLSDYIYKALTNRESVHLENWTIIKSPSPSEGSGAEGAVGGSGGGNLLADMDLTKQIVELGLSLRGSLKLKVKQPLQSLKINKSINPAYENIIKEELNIKELSIDESLNNQITIICIPNARIVGKKLGGRFAEINTLAKSGSFTVLSDNRVQVSDIVLEVDEYELRYEKGELAGDLITSGDLILMLDATITPELKLEGYARELIRSIQEARKAAGYEVTDRINVSIGGYEADQIISKYSNFITSETLSSLVGSNEDADYSGECDVDDGIISFSIKR